MGGLKMDNTNKVELPICETMVAGRMQVLVVNGNVEVNKGKKIPLGIWSNPSVKAKTWCLYIVEELLQQS